MKDAITDEFYWGWKESVLSIIGLLLVIVVFGYIYTRLIV